MYVTLQVPAERVQVVDEKVPVLLVVKVTVPVGTIAPVPDASATVTVQVVAAPVFTEAGEQETLVAENLMVDASVKVPLLPV